MAGICIPGMEMPRACVWREDGHLRTCPLYDIDGYCGAINSEACHKEEEHHPDCPALFVPDHGRLGDLDALKEIILDYIEEYSWLEEDGLHNLKWCAMKEVEAVIDAAPTIIPADKES